MFKLAPSILYCLLEGFILCQNPCCIVSFLHDGYDSF
jgi:hypothetical protein